MNSVSGVENVSDTAFWVAFYRAVESGRKDALFRDPFAAQLTGERGARISNAMRRYEKYAYWSVIIRTLLIDRYVLDYTNRGYRTVINIGAGLDTRPYRLPLAEGTHWVEIDFPGIVEFKSDKLADKIPRCGLERVGLDLSDHAKRKKYFAELNERTGPAIVLTEGVIPYLDENAVSGLARDIYDQENFKLWISEYYSPEIYPRFQARKFKDSLGDSSFRFFPEDWFVFFEKCGWAQKEMDYLYDEAAGHGRGFPVPRWASLLKLIFGERRLAEKVRRLTAYVVFEKVG